jgi:hypothetical protein
VLVVVEVATDDVEVVGVGTVDDVEVDVVESGSVVDVVEVDVVESGSVVDVVVDVDVEVEDVEVDVVDAGSEVDVEVVVEEEGDVDVGPAE